MLLAWMQFLLAHVAGFQPLIPGTFFCWLSEIGMQMPGATGFGGGTLNTLNPSSLVPQVSNSELVNVMLGSGFRITLRVHVPN